MQDLRDASRDELVTLLKSDVAEWNRLYAAARKASGYTWGANLTGADLTSAYLTRANLTGADLTNAYLTGAYLTRADLTGANLTRANLTNAYLTGAYLTNAYLTGADLTNANLTRANLTRANLTRALIDGKPITVADWCDLHDLPRTGKNLRVAYKRLPESMTTGHSYKSKGGMAVKWTPGRWVEAADWKPTAKCGGGLHLSPSPAGTRYYSDDPVVVCVAFDPTEAVLLGDKIKVKRAKVMM
jgi:2',3'-cyclic-nucleotide 2'-phosphodiesterase (5'-nucleotidase family)